MRSIVVAHLQLGFVADLPLRLDPESWHHHATALLEQVEQLAHQYGGMLHHHHGETMVVVFGLPHAHGTECARAIQMALAARDSMRPDHDVSVQPPSSSSRQDAGIQCRGWRTDRGGD